LGRSDILLARFNADGSLDTTYATSGSDGYELFNFSGTDQGWQMTLDNNGKAVLGGDTTNTIASQDIVVIRLNTNGSLDTSFDSDGKARYSFTSGQDGLRGIEVDDSNRIVIAGKGGGDFQVARLTTSGALDTTFDTDGKQSISINGTDDGDALVIDGSGRIIIAGAVNGSKDFGIVRLTASGALDMSFDTDGKQTVDFSGGTVTEECEAIMLQSDGKIVLAGYFRIGRRYHRSATGGRRPEDPDRLSCQLRDRSQRTASLRNAIRGWRTCQLTVRGRRQELAKICSDLPYAVVRHRYQAVRSVHELDFFYASSRRTNHAHNAR
jgi:uncharacterized delta-60 repeat protein